MLCVSKLCCLKLSRDRPRIASRESSRRSVLTDVSVLYVVSFCVVSWLPCSLELVPRPRPREEKGNNQGERPYKYITWSPHFDFLLLNE